MTITPRDKIDILLAEHTQLWEQMNTRVSAGSVSASYISLVLTVFTVAGIQFNYRPIYVVMPLLIGVFVSAEIVRQTYVLALGRYITRLEKKVNLLAEENLLIWDSRVTLGRIGRGFTIKDPISKKQAFNPIIVAGFMTIALSLGTFIYSTYEGTIYLLSINQLFAWMFLGINIIIIVMLALAWVSATYLIPPLYEQFIDKADGQP